MTRRHIVVTAAALASMVPGLVLVERLGTTYRDGLEVTADAADVTVAGITAARSLAIEVAELAAATANVVEGVGQAIGDGATTTAQVGEALRSNVAQGVDGTAGVADDLAAFIEFLERLIPGNRDSLAEDLRSVADGLEPLPGQLRRLGADLTATSGRLDASVPAIETAATQLTEVAQRMAEAAATMEAAQDLATQLSERAEAARHRADGDLWIARLIVVLLCGGVWLVATTGRFPQSASDAT